MGIDIRGGYHEERFLADVAGDRLCPRESNYSRAISPNCGWMQSSMRPTRRCWAAAAWTTRGLLVPRSWRSAALPRKRPEGQLRCNLPGGLIHQPSGGPRAQTFGEMQVGHRVPCQVVANQTGDQRERRNENYQRASTRTHAIHKSKTVVDNVASDTSVRKTRRWHIRTSLQSIL